MSQNNYIIKEMTAQDFKPLYDKHRELVFEADHSYALFDILSDREHLNIQDLKKTCGDIVKIYLGAFDDKNNFVGWSWGFQENSTTFYMCNSGVLEDHRLKGIYHALMNKMLEKTTDMGFQLIYSKHCATNNSILIPKLKSGFIISKMEIDDRFGVAIHLHYYTNKLRRKIMDYRSGQMTPDQEIKNIFRL